MTVTARFNGPGNLVDRDSETKTDEPIEAGGTFVTTKKRFGELKSAGFDLDVVEEPANAAANKGGKS